MEYYPNVDYELPRYISKTKPAKEKFIPYIIVSSILCITVAFIEFLLPCVDLINNWKDRTYMNVGITLIFGFSMMFQVVPLAYVLIKHFIKELDDTSYSMVNIPIFVVLSLNLLAMIFFIGLLLLDDNGPYSELIQTLLIIAIGYFGFDTAMIIFFLVSFNIYFCYPDKKDTIEYYRINPFYYQ